MIWFINISGHDDAVLGFTDLGLDPFGELSVPVIFFGGNFKTDFSANHDFFIGIHIAFLWCVWGRPLGTPHFLTPGGGLPVTRHMLILSLAQHIWKTPGTSIRMSILPTH